MTPEPLRGRCHCGDVRFTVSDGVGALACHCDDCRKSHGDYMAFLAAPAASVKVEGAEHLTWYDSSAQARRAFCRRCGGRLFKAVGDRWMVVRVPPAASSFRVAVDDRRGGRLPSRRRTGRSLFEEVGKRDPRRGPRIPGTKLRPGVPGAIEGPTGMRFVKQLWVESKGDWYDVPETEVAR